MDSCLKIILQNLAALKKGKKECQQRSWKPKDHFTTAQIHGALAPWISHAVLIIPFWKAINRNENQCEVCPHRPCSWVSKMAFTSYLYYLPSSGSSKTIWDSPACTLGEENGKKLCICPGCNNMSNFHVRMPQHSALSVSSCLCLSCSPLGMLCGWCQGSQKFLKSLQLCHRLYRWMGFEGNLILHCG